MKRRIAVLFSIALLFSAVHVWAQPQVSTINNCKYTLQPTAKQVYRHQHLFNNKELLNLLKIDAVTLRDKLKEGKSLSEIAAEKGVKKEKLVALLVGQAEQRINQAVKDGRISSEKANQYKEKIEFHISKLVDKKGIFPQYTVRGNKIKDVASILEMKPEDVFNKLRDGKSIAQIAAEKGVKKEQLVDLLVKKEKEYIVKWVDKTWNFKKVK